MRHWFPNLFSSNLSIIFLLCFSLLPFILSHIGERHLYGMALMVLFLPPFLLCVPSNEARTGEAPLGRGWLQPLLFLPCSFRFNIVFLHVLFSSSGVDREAMHRHGWLDTLLISLTTFTFYSSCTAVIKLA